MFKLIDTFNDRVISRHRTAEAAQKAREKHQRAVRRANGAGSYIPTEIRDHEGHRVDWAGERF